MRVSGPSGRPIRYHAEDTECEGWFVPPPSDERRPCILIAHDWSGINPYIKQTAAKLAAEGYGVFALDLYGAGKRGDPVGDNQHLMAPLIEDRSLLRSRLLGGLAYAQSLPGVDASKMGALGYCFGGIGVLDLVRSAPKNLRVAISVHGGLTLPDDLTLSYADPRVLILHGWEDPLCPPEDVIRLAQELTQAGIQWELHAYGHAEHAFTFVEAKSPERGIQYHPYADRRSWKATIDTFAEVFSG